MRPTRSGAIGAPPYITQRTPVVSMFGKHGWFIASQKIAGTEVSELMRSALIVLRNT